MNPDAARTFLYGHARLLERRVYESIFEGAPADGVVAALGAYRNADGGFGNGLEPDKRVPASQALDVEVAFERLVMAQADAPELAHSACDWLATVADPSGAVPILMPTAADFPRAAHWTNVNYPAGLNPTAGIVAHANTMRVEHEWVERATEFCFAEIEAGRVEAEGHSLLGVTKFLESVHDQMRSELGLMAVQEALKTASFFKLHADSDDYGVTPLDFAAAPDSLAAMRWFSPDIIEPHLDALEAAQQDDGGWPIAWEPISEAVRGEWRGIKTLNALMTLKAYGRT